MGKQRNKFKRKKSIVRCIASGKVANGRPVLIADKNIILEYASKMQWIKGGLYLLIVMLSIFISLNSVNALTDLNSNIKQYNYSDSSVKIYENSSKLLLDMKLDTPHNNLVGVGKNILVHEFTIRNLSKENKVLFQDMEFYNLKNGEKINKTISYKYGIESYRLIPVYCPITKVTPIETICSYDNITEYTWVSFSKLNEIPNGVKKIGWFVETLEGESIEAIPNILGKWTPEYASWNASFNENLQIVYTFNETGGDLIDRIFGINNGTNTGVTYNQSGKYQNAYKYGVGNKTVIPANNSLFGNSFIISAWVNMTNSGANQVIFDKGKGVSGAVKLATYSSGGLRFQCYGFDSLGTDVYALSTTLMNTNQWYHVACAIDTNVKNIKIYVNGVLEGTSANASNPLMTSTADQSLGAWNDGTNHFNGWIDEVYIYSGTKTTSFINSLYDGGTGSFWKPTETLSVNAYYPTINQTITVNNSDFKCNFTSTNQNINHVNLTIFTSNNTLLFTETESGLNTFSYNKTWSDVQFSSNGNYSWNCTGYGSESVNGVSATRYFTIDILTTTSTIGLFEMDISTRAGLIIFIILNVLGFATFFLSKYTSGFIFLMLGVYSASNGLGFIVSIVYFILALIIISQGGKK